MKKLAIALGLGVAFAASSASAALISDTSDDGNENSLNCLFNGASAGGPCTGSGWITSGPALDPNAEAFTSDSWVIGAAAQGATNIIIEIAGFSGANTFGIYNPNDTSKRFEIWNGAACPGSRGSLFFNGSGEFIFDPLPGAERTGNIGSDTFGFYLDGPGGTFFSDAAQNPNGDEQMVAFAGGGRSADFLGLGSAPWESGEFVIAWEDKAYAGSDQDFNDMVLIIESIFPVPAPGVPALLGLGLALIGLRRKALAA
jgi:hypothetical protein